MDLEREREREMGTAIWEERRGTSERQRGKHALYKDYTGRAAGEGAAAAVKTVFE